MILKTKLFGKVYQFTSVKEVLAKANEEKSGDKLAGVAANSAEERVAAKVVLSELSLNDLFNNPVVDYDEDEVTRIIIDQVNMRIFESIKHWTVAELREFILSSETTDFDIKRISRGLTSEMIAAVCKLMSNMDLIVGAKKINIEKTANTTIGRPGTFSNRLQPNHPTDNVDGIMASVMEGLSYGAGDALIGLNPVDDSTGSEKGNTAFGLNAEILAEAQDLALHSGQAAGPNVMYFETGQGSELSSEANFGADQVTMEARCYGLAKKFDPYIVNTVVGFIGPEYLYDSKQVIRAGLEDHFMGKLTGISMGCDVCYTNHMKADQNDMENLAMLLATAGCTYIMGIPHGDDVMLNYQTTGFHETATIRETLGLRPIKEFEEWMEKMGLMENGKLTSRAGDASVFIK